MPDAEGAAERSSDSRHRTGWHSWSPRRVRPSRRRRRGRAASTLATTGTHGGREAGRCQGADPAGPGPAPSAGCGRRRRPAGPSTRLAPSSLARPPAASTPAGGAGDHDLTGRVVVGDPRPVDARRRPRPPRRSRGRARRPWCPAWPSAASCMASPRSATRRAPVGRPIRRRRPTRAVYSPRLWPATAVTSRPVECRPAAGGVEDDQAEGEGGDLGVAGRPQGVGVGVEEQGPDVAATDLARARRPGTTRGRPPRAGPCLGAATPDPEISVRTWRPGTLMGRG